MFGFNNKKMFTVGLGDPGADKNITLLRGPAGGMVIENLWASNGVALTNGAGTGLTFTVYNGGTSGTAQTVVGSALGGTTVAWTAQLPKSFSLSANLEIGEGEFLWVAYDEEGTVAPFVTIGGQYRLGSLS